MNCHEADVKLRLFCKQSVGVSDDDKDLWTTLSHGLGKVWDNDLIDVVSKGKSEVRWCNDTMVNGGGDVVVAMSTSNRTLQYLVLNRI